MAAELPANKKSRVENMNLFDSLSSLEISCIFSYLDPLYLLQSITIVNKQFLCCVKQNSTDLFRNYCESHGLTNDITTWMETAKMDLQSNINIQKLLIWNFPTMRDGRYELHSKYIHDVIKDGLIQHKTLSDGIYEYESVDKMNSSLSCKVKCDNQEILTIDSFVVQTFNRLRSLGNIEPAQRESDIWEGYKKRGDIFWKCVDKNDVKEWLTNALLPGDYTYNLYCINNRRGRGRGRYACMRHEVCTCNMLLYPMTI
eukprot:313093_1